MKKNKFLVITNHSYMLWQFRRELIEELLKIGEVVISVPFGDHVDDFKAMGCRMIDTSLDRRSINPIKDLGLYRNYRKLLKAEQPDMVITYSIKPNVYGGYACRKLKIPYCVNVQGLGTAFQKKGLATLVKYMYKFALKKSKVTFFENEGNANLFVERKIIPANNICLLPGAGVNLERYSYSEYPQNDKIHFLYLGRIMREKGMALDPRAEFEIYKQFNDLVYCKTAIYISHRLSSARFCDKIAVFENGCITEYGNHDGLIKNNGKYRELYNMQAEFYT